MELASLKPGCIKQTPVARSDMGRGIFEEAMVLMGFWARHVFSNTQVPVLYILNREAKVLDSLL